MSRFGKTGLIVLAVVGVLAFFSPFGTGPAFGQKPTTPVNVMNIPLPVTVMNDVASSEPNRALVTLSAYSSDTTAVAYVDFGNPIILESLSASCSNPPAGAIGVSLTTSPPANLPLPTIMSSSLSSGTWMFYPSGALLVPINVPYVNHYGITESATPVTSLGYPAAGIISFNVDRGSYNVNCLISVVVRYVK